MHFQTQFPWHNQTVARTIHELPPSEERRAMILVGSVARGDARSDSDVDILLLMNSPVPDSGLSGTSFPTDNWVVPPCGGLSLEYIDQSFLNDAQGFGSEPTRYMFKDALLLYGNDLSLAYSLKQIATYPRYLQKDRILEFASQLPAHFSFLELAEYSGNRYLLSETAYKLVHFAGRLVLAINAELYPGRKWFWRSIRLAYNKPSEFCDLALALLEQPSIAKGEEFLQCLYNYYSLTLPPEDWQERYTLSSIRKWRKNPVDLIEC